jgi:hypothetical protein
MRAFVAVCLALGLLVPSIALAQDAEALRRELEEMRRQFEATRQQYEKNLQTLSERIQRLEARPQTAAAPPVVVQAPPPPRQPSLLELAQPRQPFALYERRGTGQLLFDMGIAGDFVANLVQRNVDKANAGTFAGRENRFFPREVELSLFGQVDPYARAEVRIEAGEEEPGAESGVSLAEATLTLLTLPWGTQVKLGQMRNRFGLVNQLHEHDMPQIDRPNVLTRFLGDEGLVEKGAELTWIPPLPFFLETLVGVFNGDNETAFGRGSLKMPLVTGRVRTFFELGDTSAIQFGFSGARGSDAEHERSTLAGFDAKYKLRPEGWRHPLLTVAGEALYSIRDVVVFSDSDGDGLADTGTSRTRRHFGWYAYAEVQPWLRWALGARYDWTQYPVMPGNEWAIEPYVGFMPSEFLRFRLGYKHTERSHRVIPADDRGSGRILDELFFQASFILGAHPAHPF